MLDLDDLEAKAGSALMTNEIYPGRATAASPEVVLDLIRELREARAALSNARCSTGGTDA